MRLSPYLQLCMEYDTRMWKNRAPRCQYPLKEQVSEKEKYSRIDKDLTVIRVLLPPPVQRPTQQQAHQHQLVLFLLITALLLPGGPGRGPGPGLKQVREVAVDRVQQGLAGLLALGAGDLEQAVQFVVGGGDLLDDLQLLGVQDVQHVVEHRLEVTGVQADLPQHGILPLCGGAEGGRERGGERGRESQMFRTKQSALPSLATRGL